MTTLRAWFGLLLVASFGVIGCGEVDHCPKGAVRCLGGLCDDGACDFDLQCAVRSTGSQTARCTKSLGDDLYDFGDGKETEGTRVDGDGGGDGDGQPNCGCTAPEVCGMDGETCVNYCEPEDRLPGSEPSPEAFFCEHLEGEEEPYTYEQICKLQCQNACQRLEQFCGHTCAEGTCEAQETLDKCELTCPKGQADALSCLTRACNETRDQTCSDVICPDTNAPASCEDLTCRNTCGPTGSPGKWVGDGECDDGDPFSSNTASCTWGTDCIDCGPRKGAAPAPTPIGGACGYHSSCRGHSDTVALNKAWCMRLSDVQAGLARCMPDCSGDKTCPDGYACSTVNNDDTGEPIEMDGIQAQACIPLMCGS